MIDSSCPNAIEMIGLTKRFGSQVAVDDLNLQIPKGTAFGFIGPNGAGKSTTIKMLMGMLRASAGEARLLGADVSSRPSVLKQRVGYVPEQHFIYRWMRVGEVIGFCRGLYDHWNDRRCDELLHLFELDVNRTVKHLSKGMVVKLALLLALAHEPELLILDEPTSGLDPIVREEFLDGVLRTLCEREQTVFLSSHTLSDVQRVADTIGLIYEGRLLVHCSTEELLSRTKRIRMVLRDGCSPADVPEGTIWQRFQHREWLLTVRGFSQGMLERLKSEYPLEHVEVLDIGLEDIFKDYVKGQRVSS